MMPVSGGKDSLSLWRILLNLGFEADGLYLNLGIDAGCDYSHKSGEYVQEFARNIPPQIKLHVLNIAETYGKTLPEIAGLTASGRRKPCSVCGMVKRHEMNRVARELGYTVIATGHNLDDEAAVLFGNVLRWETQYLIRQSPMLQANGPGLVKRAKPLARFYERETAAYAILSGIDYIQEECPFSVGARSILLKCDTCWARRSRPGSLCK
jgi:tRNA(Ile)-lysidine synthase TilS/MesJ